MRNVDLRHVGIAIWVLSWLGVIGAYAASAWGGHLPDCVPHLTGCTNVSTSGRYGAGFFIFKATIIPTAVLLALYWLLAERWLRVCGDSPTRWGRAMLWIGVVGAAALVLYATFLGAKDDPEFGGYYRAMRRYGTVVYFGFTYLAELMLVYRARALFGPIRLVQAKLILCVAMLAEGLVLEACTYFIENDAWLENITEWHVASGLTFFPFLTWLLWRKTGFVVAFQARNPA